MIKLIVEDFCQNCPYFEPTLDDSARVPYSDCEKDIVIGDTKVLCEHYKKCIRVADFIVHSMWRNEE